MVVGMDDNLEDDNILKKLKDILKTVFGFNEYLPNQEKIISSIIIQDKDALAIMPTGSGKSLLYQLPGIYFKGLTIVVSPLIALMKDQVDELVQLGIKAKSLNSSHSTSENNQTIKLIRDENLQILYITPERLMQPDTLNLFKLVNISLIAIDEAHCVDQWGHDFREEYLELGSLRSKLNKTFPILALTATADEATEKVIINKIFLQKPPMLIKGGYDRPNLHLAFMPKEDSKKQILTFIQKYEETNGIIYCSTRKNTEEMATYLTKNGYHALPYHAGLDNQKRNDTQEAFIRNDNIIITATTAFGMGIDKPNVRFVCHLNMPKNIESYYQEIGRAGRDRFPSYTLTLYGLDDIVLRTRQIESSQSDEDNKRLEYQRLYALISLCEAPRCRRQVLLEYFNEKIDKCNNCDICDFGIELIDATTDAQKVLSAIARTGQRFGVNHIVDLLIGNETNNIKSFKHDLLPTFGVGKDYSNREWKSIIMQMIASGHIKVEIAKYGKLTITKSGNEILHRGAKFYKRKNNITSLGKIKPKPLRTYIKDELIDDLPSKCIFDELKKYRTTKYTEKKVAPFMIFYDQTIIGIANSKPTAIEDLNNIHGLGKVKIAEYGEDIINIVKNCIE